MADYDVPRPSAPAVGSTDPAVAKDNLITIDKIVNDTGNVTNRKGAPFPTLGEAVSSINANIAAVDSAKNQAITDINADVTSVESSKNQAITDINADVTSVDTAKNQAIVDIDTDVNQVVSESQTAINNAVQQITDDAEQQRADINNTFQAQFSYKRLDNISAVAGQQLQDADRLNAYQYPDDSGQWYGALQSQTFPITIPADPAASNQWALISAITELSAIARGLNVPDSQVGFADIGATVKEYLHNRATQITYSVPSDALTKSVKSVTGGLLTTNDDATYTLEAPDEKAKMRERGELLGWIDSYSDSLDQTEGARAWALAQLPIKSACGPVVTGQLTFADNCVITLTPDTKFLDNNSLTITGGVGEKTIELKGTKNIIIHGNGAVVDHLGNYTTDEQRHCVNIGDSAENIVINNLYALNAGGDGFYVGGIGPLINPPKNIVLNNCHSTYSRRQGISIQSVAGLRMNGGAYTKTGKGIAGGTFPMAGIDFEPDDNPNAELTDIVLNGVDFSDNLQKGIEFALHFLTATSKPVEITINDPILNKCGFGIRNQTCNVGVKGVITVNRPVMNSIKWSPVEHFNWSSEGATVVINDPIVNDANPSNTTADEFSAQAMIKMVNTSDTRKVGNLTVSNVSLQDSPNIRSMFKYIQSGLAGYEKVSLINQDANKIDNHVRILSNAGAPWLHTEFSQLRERVITADPDVNDFYELGAKLTNRGATEPTQMHVKALMLPAIAGNSLFFENVEPFPMKIFTTASGWTLYPQRFQTDDTKTIDLPNLGDSVTLDIGRDRTRLIVKDPVI